MGASSTTRPVGTKVAGGGGARIGGYTLHLFSQHPWQLYREMGVQLRALVTPASSIAEARNTFARHCTSTEVATFPA